MTINKEHELLELQWLQKRKSLSERDLSARLLTLNGSGIPQEELAAAIGKSQPQVSRMIREAQKARGVDEVPKIAATAMELVRRAERGEIEHDRLVELLKSWDYEPSDTTRDLLDIRIEVANSLDAVDVALDNGLITEDEYYDIMDAAA